jgi:hypothetical protein
VKLIGFFVGSYSLGFINSVPEITKSQFYHQIGIVKIMHHVKVMDIEIGNLKEIGLSYC